VESSKFWEKRTFWKVWNIFIWCMTDYAMSIREMCRLFQNGRLLMQLYIGADYDGNVISRVMTTLSLHRSTELGRWVYWLSRSEFF
jgi:hypothetical protein